MKYLLTLLINLCCFTTGFAAEPLDAFAEGLQDLQGKTLKLAELPQQNRLVLMFWGTWCDICKTKMKTVLTDVQKNKQADVITIGLDKDKNRIAYAVQKEKILFPVYVDPAKKLIKELKVFGAPHWAVYKKGADGKWSLIDTASGFEDKDFLAALSK